MNSRIFGKKRLNKNSSKEEIHKVIHNHHLKPKKKYHFSTLSNKHLVSNWIENEINDDEESEYLSTMKNILFLDLENFSTFNN